MAILSLLPKDSLTTPQSRTDTAQSPFIAELRVGATHDSKRPDTSTSPSESLMPLKEQANQVSTWHGSSGLVMMHMHNANPVCRNGLSKDSALCPMISPGETFMNISKLNNAIHNKSEIHSGYLLLRAFPP